MSSDNLDYQRQKGVKSAWRNERENVLKGHGTRDWDLFEMIELIACNSVSGYEGHHMLSVKDHPEEASNPDNIQFLKREEHLEAHKNDFHNQTDGYYDFENKKMIEFEDGEFCQQKTYNLRDETPVEEPEHLALEDDIINCFEDHPEDQRDDFAPDYSVYDDTSEISEGDDFAPDYSVYDDTSEISEGDDFAPDYSVYDDTSEISEGDDFAPDYSVYDDTSEISEGDDFAPNYDSYTENNESCSEEDYTMNR